MSKKSKKSQEIKAGRPVFEKDVFDSMLERLRSGEPMTAEDFDVILRKAADDIHTFTSMGNRNPFQYLSDKTGIPISQLNSYFFTNFSIYNKDIDEKMKPYVAFTLAIIHAINLGFLLGEIKYGNTSNTSSGLVKSGTSGSIITSV